jgi:hypothetical protein
MDIAVRAAAARLVHVDPHREPARAEPLDDEIGIGVRPVVLRLLGDLVVAGGDQGASTISTVSLRNRLRGCRANAGPRWSTIRSAADFDTPNSSAS